MIAIKKINNNVSLCVDDNGVELIAFGKGIGYREHPYEIEDLTLIQRTFYGLKPQFIDLIQTIPENIIEISLRIVELTNTTVALLANSNVVFTLADHINFAITRHHSGVKVKYNWYGDIAYKFQKEVEVGKIALAMIEQETGVSLAANEAFGIAIHLINAESEQSDTPNYDIEVLVQKLVKIVEDRFQTTIASGSFSYVRFHSHILFLVDRVQHNTRISTENIQMFYVLKYEYAQAYDCALAMARLFSANLKITLNDEEILYLIIHINRLGSREG